MVTKRFEVYYESQVFFGDSKSGGVCTDIRAIDARTAVLLATRGKCAIFASVVQLGSLGEDARPAGFFELDGFGRIIHFEPPPRLKFL